MNHDILCFLTALLRPTLTTCLVVLVALRPVSGVEADTDSNFGLKFIAEGLSAPMALASLPDDSGRLMLVATIPSCSAMGARWTVAPLALKEFPNGRIKSSIWALGEDADGELYVLANGINSAFALRGKVFKLVPR